VIVSQCIGSRFSLGFHDLEVVGLGQTPSEDDDQDWGTCTEPEQASPAMRGGWDKGAIESCGEEVTRGITHLE
jgi:hypothetical protein